MRSFPKSKRNKTTEAPLHPAEACTMLVPTEKATKTGHLLWKDVDCQADHNNEFLHWSAAVNLEALIFPLAFTSFASLQITAQENSPDTRTGLPVIFPWMGGSIFPGFSLFPVNPFNILWTEPLPFIASALLFYRWHLAKAGGEQIPTTALLSSGLCSAKTSLCGWEWAPWRETHRVSTETILRSVGDGTDPTGTWEACVPWQGSPQKRTYALSCQSLSWMKPQRRDTWGNLPACVEACSPCMGTNSFLSVLINLLQPQYMQVAFSHTLHQSKDWAGKFASEWRTTPHKI